MQKLDSRAFFSALIFEHNNYYKNNLRAKERKREREFSTYKLVVAKAEAELATPVLSR